MTSTSFAPVSITAGINTYGRGPSSRPHDESGRRRPARRLSWRHRRSTGAVVADTSRRGTSAYGSATDHVAADAWALNSAPTWVRRWSM